MRSSFKYNPEFGPDEPGAVDGQIPPGRVVDMRLVFESEPKWLIVVDEQLAEHLRKPRIGSFVNLLKIQSNAVPKR